MADQTHPVKKSKSDPHAMEMAREARALTNTMTDEQREEAFRRGMQLIYGGDATRPALPRRHRQPGGNKSSKACRSSSVIGTA